MSGMVYIRPFGQVGNTVNTAVSTAGTSRVAVTRPNMGTQTVRIVNSGTETIFLQFGKDNTVTASTTTGMPMLGNTVETFLLPNDITHIAAVAASAGNTMYVTTGESA